MGGLPDRFKLAQDEFNNFSKASDPTYQASLRDAIRAASAGGALGSGKLNTSIGDLAQNRNLELDTQRNSLLNNALTGGIEDAFRKTGITQQQQEFQRGQKNDAFDQSYKTTALEDSLKNSAFGRSLQQLLTGQSGDPTQTLLALSGIYGQQGSQASQALMQMIQQLSAKGSTSGNQALLDQIKQYLAGTGAGGAAPGNVPGTRGYQAPAVPGIQPVSTGPLTPYPYTGTVTSPGPQPYNVPGYDGGL